VLQDCLRNGAALEEIKEKYAIDIKPHPRFPYLFLFKYDMIESPMAEPLVQECRGIILDSLDNWNIVCRAFNKFHNYGEELAAMIDWGTAKVQEKLDGSLMQMFYFAGEWRVASSGTPDAGGNVNGFDFTFAELFWRVWNEMGYKTDQLTKGWTYAFELMTPYNKIVVQHKGNSLVLIGARNLADNHEHYVGDIPINVRKVQTHDLKDINQILLALPDLDPLKSEGYIVVDGDFRRVKIKSPKYVALHRVKGSWSFKNMVEIVRTGEISEVVNAFPEYADDLTKTKAKFDELVLRLETLYQQHKHLESQKDFALAIKGLPMYSALFSLRKGEFDSVREWMAHSRLESLVDVLLGD